MPESEITLRGVVKPDGTLELDEKVPLPAGPVEVRIKEQLGPTMSGTSQPGAHSFWKGMKLIWDRQAARGHIPRTREEVDAEVNALREEAEEELRAVERLGEPPPPPEGQAGKAGA